MKIGEFANKFGLNVSTVRFYVNHGLLIPKKKNEQYEFDKACISDMENILKYKSYHFSLEEIHLLFFLEKASRFKDDIVLGLCSEILENKRKELIAERDSLSDYIDSLEKEIDQLPKSAVTDSEKAGIPFSFIPYLFCPKCQVPLKLDSASISEGFLQEGHLWCDCGYRANIEDGIIVSENYYEETPFKAFENIESIAAIPEQFGPTYRMLIQKTYMYMYNNIANRLEDPLFIMAGPFTFNFLLAYIDKLGKKNTYIVIDPSKKRIEKLRSYLSSHSYNIVYVVSELANTPMKHNSVDIYIDDYSTVNSMFTFNSFDTQYITPFLKRHARIAGIFSNYRNAPKSLANFKKVQPDFKPEKMTLSGLKYSWSQNGVTITDEKTIGSTSETNTEYSQDVKGEYLEVLGYLAHKDPSKDKGDKQ